MGGAGFDWTRVRAAFESALDLPLESRSAFLERELGDALAERLEVERLLALESDAREFLSPPSEHQVATLLSPEHDVVGKRVGPYRIVSVLAAGGMGVVYEAQQETPSRKVALKMIRPTRADPRVERRFREEIETLARLRHPGIAQVHEVGVMSTSAGDSPWFAMELVEGARPCTEYARAENLSTSARLSLFTSICDAVHHGHQRGVIHRDLKPSNVLVDSEGRAKIIDFGIARAIDRPANQATMTQAGEIVGTLAYMSPEQLRGDARDLDVRADVYALGILLHELLEDRPPFPVEGKSWQEVLTRIVDLDDVRASIRVVRGSDELAWIVLKAIAAERERRYESALDLARDVDRYLRDEPIAAGPPSRRYRLAKFVRRHRLAVSFSAMLAAAIVGAFHFTNAARVRAERAESDAISERRAADAAATRAETVVEFMLDLFRSADPNVAARDLTMAGALDRAAEDYDRRFESQGDLRASIADTIGRAYSGLGLAEQAEEHLARAVRAAEEHYGADHVETANVLVDLARVAIDNGALDRADEALARARSIFDSLGADPSRRRVRLEFTEALLLGARGNREAARDRLAAIVDQLESSLGPDHRDTLLALGQLAGFQHQLGDLASAAANYRRALSGATRLRGAEHPETLALENNLAMARYFLGEKSDAVSVLTRVLETRRRVLGAAHPDTVSTLGNLGGLHFSEERWDDAIACFEAAIEGLAGKLPPQHPVLLTLKFNLGAAHGRAGRHEIAAERVKEVFDVRKEQLGPEHPTTLNAHAAYGDALRGCGRFDEALRELAAGEELSTRALGATHPITHYFALGYGRTLRDLGRFEEAETVLHRCVRDFPRVLEQSTTKTDPATIEIELAELYEAWGKPELARGHRERAKAAKTEAR